MALLSLQVSEPCLPPPPDAKEKEGIHISKQVSKGLMSKTPLASEFRKQLAKLTEDLESGMRWFCAWVRCQESTLVGATHPSFSLHGRRPVAEHRGCHPQVQSKHDHKPHENCKVTGGH